MGSKESKKSKKKDDFNLHLSYDVFPTLYYKRKLDHQTYAAPPPIQIPVPNSYIRSYGPAVPSIYKARSTSLPPASHFNYPINRPSQPPLSTYMQNPNFSSTYNLQQQQQYQPRYVNQRHVSKPRVINLPPIPIQPQFYPNPNVLKKRIPKISRKMFSSFVGPIQIPFRNQVNNIIRPEPRRVAKSGQTFTKSFTKIKNFDSDDDDDEFDKIERDSSESVVSSRRSSIISHNKFYEKSFSKSKFSRNPNIRNIKRNNDSSRL
jgi:hypothetical protein